VSPAEWLQTPTEEVGYTGLCHTHSTRALNSLRICRESSYSSRLVLTGEHNPCSQNVENMKMLQFVDKKTNKLPYH